MPPLEDMRLEDFEIVGREGSCIGSCSTSMPFVRHKRYGFCMKLGCLYQCTAVLHYPDEMKVLVDDGVVALLSKPEPVLMHDSRVLTVSDLFTKTLSDPLRMGDRGLGFVFSEQMTDWQAMPGDSIYSAITGPSYVIRHNTNFWAAALLDLIRLYIGDCELDEAIVLIDMAMEAACDESLRRELFAAQGACCRLMDAESKIDQIFDLIISHELPLLSKHAHNREIDRFIESCS